MRRTLFSDLHGNLEALEALLERSSGRIISVGDVLGPQGQSGGNLACLRLLKERTIPSVVGNHESSLLPYYRNGLEPWALEFLATWPYEFCDEEALVAHTMLDKEDSRFNMLDIRSPEHAKHMLRRRPRVFTGHIHLPGYWEWQPFGEPTWHPVLRPRVLELNPDFRYLIQVGSLGEPEGPELPRYLLWEEQRIEWLDLL